MEKINNNKFVVEPGDPVWVVTSFYIRKGIVADEKSQLELGPQFIAVLFEYETVSSVYSVDRVFPSKNLAIRVLRFYNRKPQTVNAMMNYAIKRQDVAISKLPRISMFSFLPTREDLRVTFWRIVIDRIKEHYNIF